MYCTRSFLICNFYVYILQEEILKYLRVLLENSRMEFPRLYFLSDEDLVELLGISRNPKALLPFAKMCFPGIETLNFALPDGISSMNTALDFALNGMGASCICNSFTSNTL